MGSSIDYQTLINYYLRFLIEFDFREARQHFGFSNFKNYQEKNLTNFVKLNLRMCLVSKTCYKSIAAHFRARS
jgi:hypothetical protein